MIQHEQIVTLKWVTTGADEVLLNEYPMEPSGEISVWAEKSRTFHLVARNRFGTTRAEARVTLEEAMANTKQATPDDKQNDIALFSAEHDFGNAKYFYAARTAIAELKRLLASRSGPDRTTQDAIEHLRNYFLLSDISSKRNEVDAALAILTERQVMPNAGNLHLRPERTSDIEGAAHPHQHAASEAGPDRGQQEHKIPLCAAHAESWFCERNHLASQDCVVCAFASKATRAEARVTVEQADKL